MVCFMRLKHLAHLAIQCNGIFEQHSQMTSSDESVIGCWSKAGEVHLPHHTQKCGDNGGHHRKHKDDDGCWRKANRRVTTDVQTIEVRCDDCQEQTEEKTRYSSG